MDVHPSLPRAREIRDRAQTAAVRELLSYWMAIHPGDRIPARADFDPLAVPKTLPNLVLTDVEREPYRFRVRLMGTGIVQARARISPAGISTRSGPMQASNLSCATGSRSSRRACRTTGTGCLRQSSGWISLRSSACSCPSHQTERMLI
ncbi:PAS domain-containing protein [Nisaea sp.]|uniref:PAS domain-containing protein n=1 Tax=Nisaea sp. TaxID=2024842 RepID=UPI0032F044C8